MKKLLLLGLGVLGVTAVMIWGAWLVAAPAPIGQADAETYARANQLYQNGQFGTAAALYQQMIANGANGADVYYNLGLALKASGDAKGASEAFASAYTLAPRDAQIAQAANAVNGLLPALTQNETALAGLALTMALAFAVLIVLERYWLGRASAL